MQGFSILPPSLLRKSKSLDSRWTELLKEPNNYWVFEVYTDSGVLVVTDSRPYATPGAGLRRVPAIEAARPDKEAGRISSDATTDAAARVTGTGLPSLEANTNRPGSDYRSLEVEDGRAETCQKACADDANCKAFTFVKPGMQGPRGRCWLKSAVPAPMPGGCCVSGVKPSAAASARVGLDSPATSTLTVAPRPDLPMFVGANSGKVVMVADMLGNGWVDYMGEVTSILVDNSGILYKANATSLITRENKLGGAPQTIDLRVPVLDFKFDSAARIIACSSSQHCLVQVDDASGSGFVQYGGKGSGVGQFNAPQGIAVDSKDRIYIADTGNHRIVRIDDISGANWIAFGSYGSAQSHFNAPWSLWVDKQDRIYVADMFNGRVVRFDDMTGSGWVSYGGFESPRHVTTDQYNRVYIADAEADQVTRIDDMTGKGKKVLQFKRDLSDINGRGKLAGPKVIYVRKPSGSAVIR
jgi:hypothetical protein